MTYTGQGSGARMKQEGEGMLFEEKYHSRCYALAKLPSAPEMFLEVY